jgi:hypothetical protein
VFVSNATGQINLATSTAGAYTISYITSGTCPDTATASITINDTIPATFNYASTTLCTNYPNVTPTIVNPGGTFTSAPAGLVFVSATTGEIDLTASAPGVYTIRYITAAVCPDTAFQSVTIQNTPSPAFNYALTDYCLGSANPTPTVSTLGGVFLSTPPGLVFVSNATGQINLATSTAGAYTISYITSGTCPDTATASITINDTIPATFNYASTSLCTNYPNVTPTIVNPGGTFTSAPAGLVFVSATTGEIDLTASAPGVYTIRYITAAVCPDTAFQSVTIQNTPSAAFSYTQSTYCSSDPDPSPTITTAGGTFSSTPAGLVFTNTTGTIDISASTAGVYTITYILAGTCPDTVTQTVTLVTVPVPTFSYGASVYCAGDPDPIPTVTTPGGTFSSTPGLVFISTSTGEIDLSASAPGTYTITHSFSGACPASATQTVTINAEPSAAITYSSALYCTDVANPTPAIVTPGGTFSASPAGLVFSNPVNGTVNLTASTPGSYTISYITGGVCPDTGLQTISIVTASNATFSYGAINFCGGANPTPTVANAGGTFSSSPAGLTFISTTTGQIDLTASTPGTYSITHIVGTSCADTVTQTVTLFAAPPDPTFTYSASSYCSNQTDPTPLTVTPGGTFSALPAGLVFIGANGTIDLSASTPGTYTITYSFGSGCPASATATVDINTSQDATFSYGGTTFCLPAVNPVPTVTSAGGTFSATPLGLVFVSTATGEIDLAASAPGNYIVQYIVPGICADTTTQPVNIFLSVPDANFQYATPTLCQGNPDPTPTVAAVGGTFSASPAGIVFLNTSTGLIDVSASTPGTYEISYTFTGPCGASDLDTIIIAPTPDPAFTYSAATYCQSGTNPTPTAVSPGGTYSASPAGLVFVSNATGEINLTASTAGAYTITYTLPGACGTTSIQNVTLIALPDASFNYGASSYCQGTPNPVPTATTAGGVYSSTAGLVFVSTSTGEINLNTSTPGTYTITYSLSTPCVSSTTQTVTINATPSAAFSYGSTIYCTDAVDQTPAVSTAGGVFSALPAGLVINPATGVVNVTGSGVNVYTITYTLGGACPSSSTQSFTVTNTATVTLSYADTSLCTNGLPEFATATPGGGTFSAVPGGLTINAATGSIDPALSAAGTYTVTYTVTGGCSGTASRTVDVSTPPSSGFTYSAASYCTGNPNPTPFVNTAGGTFSASPAGLTFVSTASGEIDLTTSAAGTYTVTYTVGSGCTSQTSQNITINTTANPAFNYSAATYCLNGANPTPTTVSPGGTFSASPAGLNFISTTTGQINLLTSSTGTYTITYNTGGPCATTSTQTITIQPAPDAGFTYAGNTFCVGTPNPIPAINTAGGTFSSVPVGIVFVSTSTGEIDVNLSTPGNYQVIYTLSGICTASDTAQINIFLTAPNASFTYPSASYCTAASDPTPLVVTPGGVFSATPAGLVINPLTGVVDLSAGTPGTYTIQYSFTGSCAASASQTFTLNPSPDAGFTYSSNSFCVGGTNPIPTVVTPGGTFSASPAGLSFVSTSTGEIDIAGSTSGTYTVTYTLSGVCPSFTTATININNTGGPVDASFSYPALTYCTGTANPSPTVVTTGGVFTVSPAGLVINPSTGLVNLTTSIPGNYTITYTISGGCFGTSSQTFSLIQQSNSNFSYSSNLYCTTDPNPVPTIVSAGGTFSSSPAGLVFTNTVTGSIDIAASTPGLYTVTHSISGFCPSSVSQNITLGSPQSADFTYGTGIVCTNGTPIVPTPVVPGGTYSVSPAALSINSGTGLVTPSTSLAGVYDITYTSPGICPQSTVEWLVVQAPANATFTYNQSAYCSNQSNPTATITTAGGTFSASPAGLVFLSTLAGTIDLAASAPGTYTVTYTLPGTCTSTYSQTLTINQAPDAGFDYATSVFCSGGTNPTPAVTTPGGTFSVSSAGLVFSNPANGTIDLTASTPGAYTISYTLTGICTSVQTRNILISTTPNPNFSYAASNYCTGGIDPVPSIVSTGGLFSATPAGITFLNTANGLIDLSASTPGTYTVNYTFSGNCPATSSQTLTINLSADAGFTYSAPQYCTGGTNPVPIVNTPGGIFSAVPAGISFVSASSGEIDLSTSVPGNYTVSYTTSGACPVVQTANIIISAPLNPNFSYTNNIFCTAGTNPIPTIIASGGTFSSVPGGISFVSNSTGVINLAASTPGTYTVTYSHGGNCPSSATQTITVLSLSADSFAYASNNYCTSGTNPIPFLNGSGGNFVSTPAGLNFVSTVTGEIQLSTSLPGNYTLSYQTGANCPVNHTQTIIISAPSNPTFSYSSSTLCTGSSNAIPTVVAPGGTFSATPAGLTFVNTTLGVINLSASSPGTYTVTYTTANACSTSSSQTITVQSSPNAAFNYPASSYCVGAGLGTVSPSVAQSGGTFSASSPSVSINPVTGVINLATSLPGSYTITYTLSGSCQAVFTQSLSLNAPVNPFFAYATNSYCVNGGTASPSIANLGGTFTSVPSGLTFLNTSSGTINLNSSAPGTYTVVYSFGGNCPGSGSQVITVNPQVSAAFSYSTNALCTNAAPILPNVTNIGGTYTSSPVGLTLNSGTGQILPVTSTPGVYNVTYTTPGACGTSQTVGIAIQAQGNATFAYPTASVCTGSGIVQPDITTLGGTFTAIPGGLVFAGTSSGAVNTAASLPGTYTVTYTLGGACPAVYSQTLTIQATPVVTFTYPGSVFCISSGTNPTPTSSGNGTFTATPGGLSINPVTGQINLASSTAGNYIITYTSTGACPAVFSSGIALTDGNSAAFSYGQTSFCLNGTNPTPTVASIGGTFTASPGGLVFANASTGQINLTASAAGTYTICYSIPGNCPSSSCQTITLNGSAVPTLQYSSSAYCLNTSNPAPTFTPAGGTFSVSPGGLAFVSTSTGQIDLANSIPGTYFVTYTTAGICTGSVTVLVRLNELPVVAVLPSGPYCTNGNITQLNAIPAGGNWIGTPYLTTSGLFNPSLTGSGSFPVTYIASNSYGCIDTVTALMQVNQAPLASISAAGPFCSTGPDEVLNGIPSGGNWAGNPFITNTGLFMPSQAGAGTYPVTYTTTLNGCSTTATANISVITGPNSGIVTTGPFCTNSGVQTLNTISTGGVWSGSPAVSASGTFDPALAGIGTHPVTYTISAGQCTSATTVNITVNALPDASILTAPFYCANDQPLFLTAATSGGSWSGGTFISPSGLFSPSLAGPGVHTIVYTVTNAAGCTASSSTNVTVNTVPTAFITFTGPFCQNDVPTALQASLPGGTWSGGTYISPAGIFDPSVAGSGLVPVSYTISSGGCSSTSTADALVYAAPNATILNPGVICSNSPSVQLSAATPGGVFSGGSYVSPTGVFNPQLTASQSNPVTYTVSNTNGCTAASTLTIDIVQFPSVTISTGGVLCENASAQVLSASISGGTWGGNSSVSPSGLFFPSLAGEGVYPITYTYNSAGCSGTFYGSVTVNPAPDATLTPLPALCVSGSPVQLSPLTTGGTFSGGSYVSSGGLFTPSAAGPGSFNVTYSVSNSFGCTSVSNTQIYVNEGPNALIFPPQPVCENAAGIVLQALTPGGFYSNTGSVVYVSTDGVFNPAAAGPGNWPVQYTVSSANGCVNTGQVNVLVLPAPQVSINGGVLPEFCSNEPVGVLNASLPGGTWYGNPFTTVTGNFYPTEAGAGMYQIFYSITGSNGCTRIAQSNVLVNQAPDATITEPIPFCAYDEPAFLGAATPGGTWAGGFFLSVNGLFVPSAASSGPNQVTYTVSGNGCTSVDTAQIIVLAVPAVTITSAQTLCDGAGNQTLNATPAGGVWAGGTYISPGGIFNPAISGYGNHLVTYSLIQSNGCVSSDTVVFTVNKTPDASFKPEFSYCEKAPNDTLIPITAGGVFSGGAYVDSTGIFAPAIAGAGSWPVSYTVSVNGCSASSTQQVQVDPLPIASFTYDPDGLIVYFTNLSQNADQFLWDFGDNSPVTGATDPIHGFPVDGSYIVRLVSINKCGSDTLILPVKVDKMVGVKPEQGNHWSMELYPNPAEDFVNLTLETGTSAELTLTLTDITGKRIESRQWNVNGGANTLTMPVGTLPSGVYLIEVQSSTTRIVRKLIRK